MAPTIGKTLRFPNLLPLWAQTRFGQSTGFRSTDELGSKWFADFGFPVQACIQTIGLCPSRHRVQNCLASLLFLFQIPGHYSG